MRRLLHRHSLPTPFPEGEPLLLGIADYEVLAYLVPEGFRISSWKHPRHIESGGAAVVYEVEDPGEEMRSRVFHSFRELETAVLETLPTRRASAGAAPPRSGRPMP